MANIIEFLGRWLASHFIRSPSPPLPDQPLHVHNTIYTHVHMHMYIHRETSLTVDNLTHVLGWLGGQAIHDLYDFANCLHVPRYNNVEIREQYKHDK